ncbi:WD40/YVTN/BNR-like repeat-containing protein [Rugosimonospora africana]|uniref:Exo-alpha-sialidase n=1 Tax=Rugosimonospora africana TaxID=556532 RepID=A0A8J3QL49_9ACTN|nr:hypothetical protein [Rugosimonospora africana]GIH12601.1 hypothetical protein Raf01_07730 [Rugosimonospora africana]
MAELDFTGLLADVEAATMLPEFDRVARRARRVRTRSFMATVFAVLAVLALLAPAGVVAARDRGGGDSLGPVSDPNLPAPGPINLQTPAPPASPSVAPRSTIVAADGADIGHVYALIDVCRLDACNLQLSQIQTGQQVARTGPDRIGLLRDKPTDYLSGFKLEALNDTSLVVSAMPASGPREYQRINLGNVPDDARPQAAGAGDRVGVVDHTGELWAADSRSGALRALPRQPPIASLNVVSTAPANGLWVTGTNPVTGDLAVSVSRNAGHTWTTAGLGVMTGGSAPVLATYQGQTAYLLTRTVDRDFALFQTVDGGQSWQRLTTQLPWPAQTDNGVGYGLVVRPDGSLLAWLATNPGPSYTQSTDHGRTFSNVAGPGGPLISVPDGYVSLSSPPKLSSDGSNWVPAAVPALATG